MFLKESNDKMSEYFFLFDLGSTITKQEILPTISKRLGIYEQMCSIIENTMRGEIPFKQSFLQRVELLKKINVNEVCQMICEIEVNNLIVNFIQRNKERCYIVTENLDVWIKKLINKIGMEANTYCSKALIKDDYIEKVFSVIDKNSVINQIILPFVAVGAENNDAEMIEAAEIGIGFGGVRNISPAVLECSSHAIYDEKTLVSFLERLM